MAGLGGNGIDSGAPDAAIAGLLDEGDQTGTSRRFECARRKPGSKHTLGADAAYLPDVRHDRDVMQEAAAILSAQDIRCPAIRGRGYIDTRLMRLAGGQRIDFQGQATIARRRRENADADLWLPDGLPNGGFDLLPIAAHAFGTAVNNHLGWALTDMMAGRVDYLCAYISLAMQAAATGQARALATFARARSPVMPDVPTAAEQGLSGLDAPTWNAIFAPKGTPPAVVVKLNAAVSQALDDATVRERLAKLGLAAPPPEQRTPEYLGRYVAAEMVRWAPAVKASGAGVE